MSAPAFTPGPWRLKKHTCAPDAVLGPRDDWSVQSPSDLGICFEGQDNPNAEADARLIAAAPELYEALSAVIGAIDYVQALPGDKGREITKAAYRALAKACGETL